MTNTGGNDAVGSNGVVSETAKRPPSWVLPAAVGVVVTLVIALGVVLLTSDEADAPVASEPATSVEAETVEADTDVTTEAATDANATPEPTATEPVVTPPATTETSESAPAATEAPAPETTAVPAAEPTTAPAAVSDVQPASPGFVRIIDDEFPIERICQSNPFPGFGLITYVFDDNGFTEVVEYGNDEGNEFGLVFGNGYSIIDFGDDGFGIDAEQGDGFVAVSVNAGDALPGPCPGFSSVSNTSNPEFQDVIHAVVDVCLGDVPRFDENGEFSVGFGYSGVIAESGQFVARPGANGGSFAVDYTGPAGAFSASTDAATSVAGPDVLQIRAELVGEPNGVFAGEARTVVIDIDESFVETCRPI